LDLAKEARLLIQFSLFVIQVSEMMIKGISYGQFVSVIEECWNDAYVFRTKNEYPDWCPVKLSSEKIPKLRLTHERLGYGSSTLKISNSKIHDREANSTHARAGLGQDMRSRVEASFKQNFKFDLKKYCRYFNSRVLVEHFFFFFFSDGKFGFALWIQAVSARDIAKQSDLDAILMSRQHPGRGVSMLYTPSTVYQPRLSEYRYESIAEFH
jgi:hypothetical protein